MTDIELIHKVIKATKLSDIFSDDWEKQYKDYCKLIHPSYSPNSLAAEAMAKINKYRDVLINKYIK